MCDHTHGRSGLEGSGQCLPLPGLSSATEAQLIHLVAGLRVGGRRSGPVIRQDSTGPHHDPRRD